MEVIIMDKNEELENISEVVKDSPIDKGLDVFMFLFKNRIQI